MKKIYLYLILLFAISGFLISKNIYAVRTDRTTYYGLSSSAMVYWSYTRDISPSSKIKIALLDDQGNYFCTIVKGLPITEGLSGYRWEFSNVCFRDNGLIQNITYGTYRIRVRLVGTNIMSESPPFQISPSSSTLHIYYVRTERNEYFMGGKAKVFWTSSASRQGVKVKIVLLNEQRQYVCTLERHVPLENGSTGHFVTLAPTCRRDNGKIEKLSSGRYAIRIRVENSQERADGNLFYLRKIFKPRLKGPVIQPSVDTKVPSNFRKEIFFVSFEINTDINSQDIDFNPYPFIRENEKEWTGEVKTMVNKVSFSLSATVTNRSAHKVKVHLCHSIDNVKSLLPFRFQFLPSSSWLMVAPGQSFLFKDDLTVLLFIPTPQDRNRTYTFVIYSVVKLKDSPCNRSGGEVSPTFKSIVHVKVPDH